MTLNDIKTEVRKMDASLSENDEAFHCAVLLLAALQEGPHVLKLAVFTGYKLDWIRMIADRLRDNGVWQGRKTTCDWFGENGGLEFWLDVSVALGHLKRQSA